MKIKGINTQGKLRGTPIPLSDTEKAAEVAKDEFLKRPPEGYRRLVYGVTIESLSVQRGRQGVSEKYADDPTYFASGLVSYKLLRLDPERLRPMKKAKFTLVFKDCKDEYGLPDTRLISYEEDLA